MSRRKRRNRRQVLRLPERGLSVTPKWQGDQDKCRKLLDQTDWSAKGDDFKIVVHALRDEFAELCSLMQRLGVSGPIAPADYKSWPLFKECRVRPDFCQAYQSVFKEPLERIEEAIPVNKEDIQQFLKEIIGKEQAEEAQDGPAGSEVADKQPPKKRERRRKEAK